MAFQRRQGDVTAVAIDLAQSGGLRLQVTGAAVLGHNMSREGVGPTAHLRSAAVHASLDVLRPAPRRRVRHTVGRSCLRRAPNRRRASGYRGSGPALPHGSAFRPGSLSTLACPVPGRIATPIEPVGRAVLLRWRLSDRPLAGLSCQGDQRPTKWYRVGRPEEVLEHPRYGRLLSFAPPLPIGRMTH
jgi:hypothetical protein